MLDVPLDGRRRRLELALARGVETEVGRVDEHVGAGQLAQLAHLDRRPGRLDRTAASEHEDLLDARRVDRLDRGVRGVRRLELLRGQREHACDVEGDVPVPDHDGPLVREVELEALEVGVAVVPGDEGGRRPAAGKVLARYAEPAVGLRAERVDDGGVVVDELLVTDVATHLDVPEEAKAGRARDLLERARDGLDVRVIRRDAEADEPPRGGQALDQIDLEARLLAREQGADGVEARGPGAHDGNAVRPVSHRL